jgi:amino acid adenylation domain-containing protein
MMYANSLSSLVTESCLIHAKRIALKIHERVISYHELLEKSTEIANALIGNGAKKEAVGIVGQRKASSYFGVLGTILSGCYYIPLNPKYNKSRLLSIIEDAGIRFLIGDRGDLELLGSVLSRPTLEEFEAIILPEGKTPDGCDWQDESTLGSHGTDSYTDLSTSDDLAYILYTSGSTGTPKGVQITQSNVMAFLASMSSIYSLDPGFRASQTFDLSFDPSVSDMFFTWVNGGVLCILPEEENLIPFEYIKREKITFWNSVPAVASFMIKMGFLKPGCFPDLKYSMFCGEQFPKSIGDSWRRAAPNSSIENLYGPTEATIYISRYVYSIEDEFKTFKNNIIPIGTPFLAHEFSIVDEIGKKVIKGMTGEIVFTGPQISKGYLHDKSKSDDVFVSFDWDNEERIWYKTGDVGFVNINGDIECIGRKDNQIKLGGRRIEIGEIEAVLARYDQLKDVVVVPIFDAAKRVVACAAFTTKVVTEDENKMIRKDSCQYLERIFFPKIIITIDTIPTNTNGKIDRKKLIKRAEKYHDENQYH